MTHDIATHWPNLLSGIAESRRALAHVEAQHPEPPPDVALSSFEMVNAYAPIESAKRQLIQRNRLLGMARDGLIEHGEGFPPPARVDQLLRADWWRGRMQEVREMTALERRAERLLDALEEISAEWDAMRAADRRARREEPLKPKLARQKLTLHFYSTPRPGQRSSYLGPLPGA